MFKKLLGIAISSVFAMSVVSNDAFAKDSKKSDKKVEVKSEKKAAKKDSAKMNKKASKKLEAKKMDMKKLVPVNINTATETELKNIPGIGEKIAKAIVEQRTKVGKFKKLEDLKSVKGIGDKSFEKMKKALSL